MDDDRIYFHRNLPHYQPDNAVFSITFRLGGTLPSEVVRRLREEREGELRRVGQDKILSYRIQKKYFVKYDEYLDRAGHGSSWLRNEDVARVVAEELHYWDGRTYKLLCYCVMPNHVHVAIDLEKYNKILDKPSERFNRLSYPLSPILHSIKRYTAREANKILHRSGAFWQHESYDHIIRDGRELERIVGYILANPVKAGFVKTWSRWKWTYLNRKYFGDEFDEVFEQDEFQK